MDGYSLVLLAVMAIILIWTRYGLRLLQRLCKNADSENLELVENAEHISVLLLI